MNIGDFILRWSTGFGDFINERFAYDSTFGMVEYYGIGPRGSANSDSAWLIFKYTYDSTGRITEINTAPGNSIWDDRATYFP